MSQAIVQRRCGMDSSKAGTRTKPQRNTSAYCFVPNGLLSLLSYTVQGHLPKGGTIKKMPPGLKIVQFDGSILYIKISFSQMTLARWGDPST